MIFQIDLCYHYIELALNGIKHFQTYYQNMLLVAVSGSMIGWIFFLYQQLAIDELDDIHNQPKVKTKTIFCVITIVAMISAFIYGEF